MIDLDSLLSAISEHAPSGEDLEYDPEFNALEIANKPGEERVIGDNVIPAEDPDYDNVAQLSLALLGRSHDLRIAVILANAVLRTGDFAAFGAALQYIHGCLDSYWNSVHPQLDEDDGDATMRVNAVLGLTAQDGVLRALRLCPLLSSRGFGDFCLRDMEIASGDLTPPEDEASADTQTVAAAFHDTDPSDLAAMIETVTTALDTTRDISAIFDAHIGAEGPDLTPLEKMLFDIKRRMSAHGPADLTLDVEDREEAEDTAASAPSQIAAPGAITSPADVRAALDRIMDYYRRYEPSSPLPLVLERAKRLVGADFLTIVRDLAPEGMSNVRNVGGIEPDDDDEGTYD
jgi:type VI secretion system protein ImpA